jgi:hypothetical protein
MDISIGRYTIRITAKSSDYGRSWHGHWAVYDGSPEDSHILYYDYTDAMPAFALAQREAKADALVWVDCLRF